MSEDKKYNSSNSFLPNTEGITCACQEKTVHVMATRFGWCQSCGMLLVWEKTAGVGPRWIYNHVESPLPIKVGPSKLVESQVAYDSPRGMVYIRGKPVIDCEGDVEHASLIHCAIQMGGDKTARDYMAAEFFMDQLKASVAMGRYAVRVRAQEIHDTEGASLHNPGDMICKLIEELDQPELWEPDIPGEYKSDSSPDSSTSKDDQVRCSVHGDSPAAVYECENDPKVSLCSRCVRDATTEMVRRFVEEHFGEDLRHKS